MLHWCSTIHIDIIGIPMLVWRRIYTWDGPDSSVHYFNVCALSSKFCYWQRCQQWRHFQIGPLCFSDGLDKEIEMIFLGQVISFAGISRWLPVVILDFWVTECLNREDNMIYVQHIWEPHIRSNKYSLLMHCIKIKSPAKSLLNEQYVFVGGNISFLRVLSCSSEEA